MSSSTLYRLSGLALVVALPLSAVGHLFLHPPSHDLVYLDTRAQGTSHAVLAGAWLLVLLGLPGLYARQAARAGIPGLVGFVLTSLSAALRLADMLFEAFIVPIVARGPAAASAAPGGPLGVQVTGALPGGWTIGAVATLGCLIFGVATIRARVLPRWTGIALVGGVILLLGAAPLSPSSWLHALAGIAFTAIFAGFAGGGFALWTGAAGRATLSPQPASLAAN